jgi:hypothetical protein
MFMSSLGCAFADHEGDAIHLNRSNKIQKFNKP